MSRFCRWWAREWRNEHAWFFGLKWLVFALTGILGAYAFGIWKHWDQIR